MKQKQYEVVLSSGTYYVRAFTDEQAVILAQAEAINEGKNYEYVNVRKVEA